LYLIFKHIGIIITLSVGGCVIKTLGWADRNIHWNHFQENYYALWLGDDEWVDTFRTTWENVRGLQRFRLNHKSYPVETRLVCKDNIKMNLKEMGCQCELELIRSSWSHRLPLIP